MNERLVRHFLFPFHERLKRKPTFQHLQALGESQWLVPTQLVELQVRRLRQLLEFAHDHVPYYRALFEEYSLSPDRKSVV